MFWRTGSVMSPATEYFSQMARTDSRSLKLTG